LSKSPEKVTIGEVLRYVQKEMAAAECVACVSEQQCPFSDNCAFSSLWQRVKSAAFQIYDDTTMQDLLDENEGGSGLGPVRVA